jgi:hypothetical protein
MAYVQKQEKKEAKRLSKSESEKTLVSAQAEECSTPGKSSKQSRRRSTSEGAEKEEPLTKAEVHALGQVEANALTPKTQRKLSKSALRRQQELEKSQAARVAKAAAAEKAKEEEASAAEAEAAAARRRALWEARDAAAMVAATIKMQAMEAEAATEVSGEEQVAALQTLAAEAAAAVSALAAHGLSASTQAIHDPDLDGWEIL